LLEWLGWDSFEFEKASCLFGYFFPDLCAFYARSYYAPFWCDVCNSSNHNINSCPYYAYYAHPESSLPLVQCTGLEVGECFTLVARFGMNNACCGLEDTFNMEQNLVDTPLEECRDAFVHEESLNLACDNVLPSLLDSSHVYTFCSQPSFSPELDSDVLIDNFEICDSNVDMGYKDNMFNTLGGNFKTFESLGYFSGYDAAFDPYCLYLVDKLRKILWNAFFVFSFDFSMAFSLIKRALTFFVLILCMLSCCQA